MAFANRAGTFKAAIAGVGVVEQGDNKLACAVVRYALIEEMVQDGWADIRGEQMEITGWHYLETRDGGLNNFSIEALRQALGWDGRDIMWLQDADLSRVVVQVVLDFESYNGRDRLKVKYLNPEGYEGRSGELPKSDPTMRRTLQTRLGAKLRAMAGGTPAPAPRPTGAPKPPASRAAPAKKPTGCTREEAWAELLSARPEDAEGFWPTLLQEAAPGKDEAAFTPEDWAKVRAKAKESASIPY
jgi:hypothetical protein